MITKGQAAYELRSADRSRTWRDIASEVGSSPASVVLLARNHAVKNDLPWPLPRPVHCRRHIRMVPFVCDGCGETRRRHTGDVNRARRQGLKLFCSRECYTAYRTTSTPTERQARKADYDRAYREENGEAIRAKKRADYLANHDARLAAQAELRADPEYRARMRAYQREHTACPEWRAHKRAYDRRYRAAKRYGEFADAHVALMELGDELSSRATPYERRTARGCTHKAIERQKPRRRDVRHEE